MELIYIVLTLITICLFISMIGNLFLLWWGFKHRMLADKAQREILPRAKAIAQQTIEEVIKRKFSTQGLSEDEGIAYAERAVARRLPQASSEEVSKIVKKEVKKVKKLKKKKG